MAKKYLFVLGNWYWKTEDRRRWFLQLSTVQEHFSSFLPVRVLRSWMLLASIKRRANEWRKQKIREIQGSYFKMLVSIPSFTLFLPSLPSSSSSSSISIILYVIFFQAFYILTCSLLALYRFSEYVYDCIEIPYYLALSTVSNTWQAVFVLLPFPQR